MARKEIYYTVEDKGRDQGKVFFIREMAASQAEWWAIRAGLAMAKNGVNLPDNFQIWAWQAWRKLASNGGSDFSRRGAAFTG